MLYWIQLVYFKLNTCYVLIQCFKINHLLSNFSSIYHQTNLTHVVSCIDIQFTHQQVVYNFSWFFFPSVAILHVVCLDRTILFKKQQQSGTVEQYQLLQHIFQFLMTLTFVPSSNCSTLKSYSFKLVKDLACVLY